MVNRIIKILRLEVEASSESLNRISKQAGVDKAAISRMMHGSSLRADSADRLLAYFDYEILKAKKRK